MTLAVATINSNTRANVRTLYYMNMFYTNVIGGRRLIGGDTRPRVSYHVEIKLNALLAPSENVVSRLIFPSILPRVKITTYMRI